MRRIARELAFKLIFEYTFTGERDDDTLEMLLVDASLTDEDRTYIRCTYTGVTENLDGLKKEIAASLEGYTLERVYRPDLVCLLIGTYELGAGDVPSKVAINEEVDLAKKYGTEKSGGFVNGVLAKIYKAKGLSD